MKSFRDLIRRDKQLRRFAKRIDDPTWPSAEDVAHANSELARKRFKLQTRLALLPIPVPKEEPQREPA